MATKHLKPVHPGTVLLEEFIRPLGLSASALAKALDVPAARVSEIVRGRRAVTADTALRLGRLLGTTPGLWMTLQSEHDLRVARRDSGEEIRSRVVPVRGPRPTASVEVRERVASYGLRARKDRKRRRDSRG